MPRRRSAASRLPATQPPQPPHPTPPPHRIGVQDEHRFDVAYLRGLRRGQSAIGWRETRESLNTLARDVPALVRQHRNNIHHVVQNIQYPEGLGDAARRRYRQEVVAGTVTLASQVFVDGAGNPYQGNPPIQLIPLPPPQPLAPTQQPVAHAQPPVVARPVVLGGHADNDNDGPGVAPGDPFIVQLPAPLPPMVGGPHPQPLVRVPFPPHHGQPLGDAFGDGGASPSSDGAIPVGQVQAQQEDPRGEDDNPRDFNHRDRNSRDVRPDVEQLFDIDDGTNSPPHPAADSDSDPATVPQPVRSLQRSPQTSTVDQIGGEGRENVDAGSTVFNYSVPNTIDDGTNNETDFTRDEDIGWPSEERSTGDLPIDVRQVMDTVGEGENNNGEQPSYLSAIAAYAAEMKRKEREREEEPVVERTRRTPLLPTPTVVPSAPSHPYAFLWKRQRRQQPAPHSKDW